MATGASVLDAKLGAPSKAGRIGIMVFGVALVVGFIYAGSRLFSDLAEMHSSEIMPFVLLGIALLVALGFEFVNGFHDTANAVATVIYTHSMEPHVAVVWSGAWNFIGVLVSTGAVAFGIVSLLPVELILQVGSKAGFAMVFALLIAAIIWNLGTWYFGLPASSSHTMVGSIIGVGIANQLMSVKTGTSGVDWGQATNIGKSLLLSPLVGFVGAALLLLAVQGADPEQAALRSARRDRAAAVLDSRAAGADLHGRELRPRLERRAKGHGADHADPDRHGADGLRGEPRRDRVSRRRTSSPCRSRRRMRLSHYVSPTAVVGDARDEVTDYIRTKDFTPNTMLAMRQLVNGIGTEMALYKQLKAVPQDKVRNFRNDMYVVSEALRLMQKSQQAAVFRRGRRRDRELQDAHRSATKFIPTWVKVAVALALGMGTMIGWKRIVVTVGEKIGKDHLTYGQGAAAEITAMFTIGAADWFGLPVSTTHVLSSGVAGTMAANHTGLQWSTVRNLAMAWVLTLPASIMLSASLFWLFRKISS